MNQEAKQVYSMILIITSTGFDDTI